MFPRDFGFLKSSRTVSSDLTLEILTKQFSVTCVCFCNFSNNTFEKGELVVYWKELIVFMVLCD